jgi:hypothetical protein
LALPLGSEDSELLGAITDRKNLFAFSREIASLKVALSAL